MKATVGDWLLSRSNNTGRQDRRGEILAVGVDGSPPYTVRWTDTDHTAVVFPGPDAEIVSAARLTELEHLASQRISAVQASIKGH